MARLRRPESTPESWQALPELARFSDCNWFTLGEANGSEFFVRTRRLTREELAQLRERYAAAIADLQDFARQHPDEQGPSVTRVKIRMWAREHSVPLGHGIDLSTLLDAP